MFKAVTKQNAPRGDTKGTLTALWSNKGKEDGAPAGDTPAPGKLEPVQQQAPTTAAEGTPEAGGRGAAAEAPVTGGEVAITAAAPDPSPAPVPQPPPVEAAPQPAAQPSAEQASVAGGSEKKRKRAADELSAEHTAKLEAVFQQHEYASTGTKQALALELGLEYAQVNKWFEKARKKARQDSGQVPARGRPKASSTKAAAATAAEPAPVAAAAADEAVPSSQVPAAAPKAAASAAAPQEATEAPPAVTPAAPAQPVAPAEQPAAEAVADAAAAAMDVDVPALDAVTPAAALRGPAELPSPAASAPVSAAAAPDAAASQQATAEQPAPAVASPAATPAAAGVPAAAATASAPARQLSVADKQQLLVQLAAEAQQLQAHGLAAPLVALPAGPPLARVAFTTAGLAGAVAGQRCPLSQLTAALLPVFKAPDSEAPLEEAVLGSHIVALATRKSFAPKDGATGANQLVDTLEDSSAGNLWQWELHDAKHLPKEQRPAALMSRKRAGRVQERLTAVAAAVKQLEAHKEGKATARLCKALAALEKAKTLEQVESEQQAEREQLAAKEAAKKQQSGSKADLSEASKQHQKQEREAEKERQKQEKEAEKERHKMEKEAAKQAEREAKEAERAAKEAERERKALEAEAAKVAKKTGFKDAKQLNKTANKFVSFFKPKGAPASPAGSVQQQQQEQSPGQQASQGTLSKGPRPDSLGLPAPSSLAEAMDAAFSCSLAPEVLQSNWQALVARTKQHRTAQRAAGRVMGLPPTWARFSNALEAAQARVDKLRESGVELAAIKTWRRKFLWFPADSNRPPYYGSRSLPSTVVRPRHFLGKDEAVDYEVMSDQDWEEEPEGSSLMGGDDESEMGGPDEEEEEEDSFICADGYLSEDEGVQLDDEMDGPAEAEELPLGAAAAAGIDAHRLLRLQQLEVQLERARRAGKPLIISRLNPATPDGYNSGAYIQGDVALLEALAGEVLLPGVTITMPPDLAAPADAPAPATAAKAAGGDTPAAAAGKAGEGKPSAVPKKERPQELVPELLGLLRANPKTSKLKATEQFLQAHAGRNIPKKWVADCIKEHADWQGGQWVLRPSALALLEGGGGAMAAAAALTPAAAGAGGPTSPAPAGGAGEGAAGAHAVPEAQQLQPQPTPAAAVQPTPGVAQGATATGGINRFYVKKGMQTPAVPTALKPSAPGSEMRAPGRLVSTTTAGEACAAAAAAAGPAAAKMALPLPPLVVPESVSSTADPYWRLLLSHIEEADGSSGGSAQQQQQHSAAFGFEAAFEQSTLGQQHVGAMPAYIVTALITGLCSASAPAAARACYVRCLRAATAAMAAAEAHAAFRGEELTASQQVWGPARTGPVQASLAGLCAEPQLLQGLQSCLAAALAAPADIHCYGAAFSAMGTAATLLVQQECRAALLEGSREQVAALVAAAQQLAGARPADFELSQVVLSLQLQLQCS